MTAVRARRRRSATIALVAGLVGLVGVAVLGVAGMRTLANSTAGQQASTADNPLPIARLPSTSTALVGVVDDDGRLTSTVAIALRPDGTGGTIVIAAASADAGSGATGELVPLDAVLAVDGPVAYSEAAERLTGLSFDVLELVDADRLRSLISPLGDLTVRLAVGVKDASTGESWPAGEIVMDAAEAARLMTADDPAIADWYYEDARAAVWEAIADRVGAGIGSAEPVEVDTDLERPSDLDEFVDRLFAGEVEARPLAFRVLPDERVAAELRDGLGGAFGGPAGVDVVSHDRAQLLMVLGAIAPARLGTPLEAPRIRLVSGFTDDDLESAGLTESELLTRALDRLLFAQVNIVSVAVVPGEDVPDLTLFRVADRDTVQGVDDAFRDLFGAGDAVLAGVPIDGVDVEIVLGRAALESLAEG